METVEETAVTLNPTAIELPQKILTRGDSRARSAMAITVSDAESYGEACSLGRLLKAEKAARLDFFKPIKRAIDASKDVVLEREKASIAPLDLAIRHLDSSGTEWRREQEQLEAERRRKAEEAERKRIAAERKQEAKEALAEGCKKLAAQILAAPIVPQVEVESEVPHIGGLRKRVNWKFRITKAAAVPREWCMPDERAIGEFVREHKENAKGSIPGVEVYSEEHTI